MKTLKQYSTAKNLMTRNLLGAQNYDPRPNQTDHLGFLPRNPGRNRYYKIQKYSFRINLRRSTRVLVRTNWGLLGRLKEFNSWDSLRRVSIVRERERWKKKFGVLGKSECLKGTVLGDGGKRKEIWREEEKGGIFRSILWFEIIFGFEK